MAPVRIGCSGWQYRSWRESGFYPEGCPQRLWLEAYAQRFDTVELNTTFYRLPTRDAVAKWVERTPEDFVFTVKASRYLTHVKRLQDLAPGAARLWERLEPLLESPKMGPVLWQLPPTMKRDDDRLAQALAALPPGHHAFEFRHASWFEGPAADDLLALLREHRVALVIGDRPERPWQPHAVTSDFTLIRFHFGHRGRRGNYSTTELEGWAREIERLRAKAAVFAYFNNDWEGFAPRNAQELQRLLQRRGAFDPAPMRKN